MKKFISKVVLSLAVVGGFFLLERAIPGDNTSVKAESINDVTQELISAEPITEETYWIHFSDGETIINSQEVVYGTIAQFPVYDVEEGYVFLGWKYYTDETQFEIITDGSGTMLSSWEYKFDITVVPETGYKEYTVTYVCNGGTDIPKDFFTMTEEVVLPTPKRTNYRFMGWFEETDCSGAKVLKIPEGTKTDKTFYAKWERLYKITYKDESLKDLNIIQEAIAGETIVLKQYRKIGYTAIWNGNRKAFSTYVMGNSNVTFYVIGWEPHKFTIKLYRNYNSRDQYYTAKEVVYGQIYQLGTMVPQYGDIFIGWFAKSGHDSSDVLPEQRRFTDEGGKSLTAWNDDKVVDLVAEYVPEVIGLVDRYSRDEKYTITDSGDYSGGEDKIDVKSFCNHSMGEFYETGYKTLYIRIQFDAWEKDDGYQWIILYDENGKRLDDIRIEHYPGSKSGTHARYQIDFYIPITSDLSDVIYVRYGASGVFSDTWYNENTDVWIDGMTDEVVKDPTYQKMS